MVFLGLEKPVPYSGMSIFDPTMANMVLNAQNNYIQAMKDDYLRGREDLKEFNKNFGDFFSPIQKDMEWYDQNVTGATRDLINNLYAQGIDPLRSVEGRAAISRWVNNMPTGKINQLKQSAATANEYLKNKAALEAKGLWNPALERQILNGRSLEDWDTARDGMWQRTSPAEYKDLNQFTTHIFDALKDSYISTEGMYDWYGVSEDEMRKALTPDTLGGLLNSDLGRFHYNNARNDLLARGIANPTDAEIMQQFRDNIVAANHEKTHRDRRINEAWKIQYENAYRYMNGGGSRGGGRRGGGGRGGYNDDDEAYGWTARRMAASYIQRKMQQGSIKSFNDWVKDINAHIRKTGKGFELSGNSLQNIKGYYKASQDTPEPGENLMALELFKNGLGTSKYNHEGDTSERTTVSFMDNDLRPTSVAEVEWIGRTMNKNGVTSRWLKFLRDHSISGQAVGKVTVNHRKATKGGVDTHIMEMNRTVRLDKAVVDAFVEEYAKQKGHSNYTPEFRDEVIKKLGLRGRGIKDTDTGDYAEYDMPTSRRVEMAGDDRALVDAYSDALEYTKATGAKREEEYINNPY